MKIGIVHYSCPPVVGGVEEVINNQAIILKRIGHNVKVLAGMGGDADLPYPVHIEPLLASNNKDVVIAHKESNKGNYTPLKNISQNILDIIVKWAKGLDVIIVHNILQMPFNLPLTLAIRKFADSNIVPLICWAHDSPYFYPNFLEFLEKEPWNILKTPHPFVHYVTISESRRRLFEKLGIKVK